MIKSYKFQSFCNGLQFSCSSAIRKNKIKIILSLFLILIAIFAGVFIAIRAHGNCRLSGLKEINLENFYNGVAASSSAFWSRSISLTINIVFLSVFTLSPFMLPLAEILLIYRGYLFGLNFALIFVFYGIGSALTAIVVILPCQLLTIFVLILFYFLLSNLNNDCKKYGRCEFNRMLFVLFALLLVILINLVETILLCVLNGQVILVI